MDDIDLIHNYEENVIVYKRTNDDDKTLMYNFGEFPLYEAYDYDSELINTENFA